MKHFLYVAEWNDWDDKEMAEWLVMAFDGRALKRLGELDNQILGNFTLLVRELNRRFDPTEWAEAWKIEFCSMFRKPKESFMLYAQDITCMVSKAYPELPKVAQDQWVKLK